MTGAVKALNLDAALAYAERHALHALVVRQHDDVLLERYGGGYDAGKPHALYSGTKSFWGVLAVAAQDDGLLELDEPVARTIPAWNEGEKARVTLRELLQLTSGIGFGGLGAAVPDYDKALATELRDEPRREVHLRRHPAASVRRRARAQARAARAHAARVPARAHPRSDRPARRLVAHAQRRHAAVADRRVRHGARVAQVRPAGARPRCLGEEDDRAAKRRSRAASPARERTRATAWGGGSARCRRRPTSCTRAAPADRRCT